MQYVKYDTEKYNFRELLSEILERTDLENLHDSVDYPELFDMKTEQSTIYHKKFYESVRTSRFLDVYNQFIVDVAKHILIMIKLFSRKFRHLEPNLLVIYLLVSGTKILNIVTVYMSIIFFFR